MMHLSLTLNTFYIHLLYIHLVFPLFTLKMQLPAGSEFKLKALENLEAYSKRCQTSKTESFGEIVEG